MLSIRTTAIAVLLFVTLAGSAGQAIAQTYQWKGVANARSTPQFALFNSFGEDLAARTKGQIKVNMVSMPELGLTGFELVRTTRAGLVDVADVIPIYVGGDLPVIEGVDLPGLYANHEVAEKAHKAFMPVLKKYEDKLGGIVVGAYLWPEQVLFSRKPIRSAADLKGMKIRVFGTAASEFLRALGAEPVSMPVAEVYSALERGTVDAAISGTSTGGSLKWYEVTKYLVDVQHGPLVGMLVISKQSWDKLTPELRAHVIAAGEAFTEKGWQVGRKHSGEWIEKNKSNGMEWLPATPAMAAAVKAAAQGAVVQGWVKRAGPEAKPVFNQYIAPHAGFQIP